MRALGVDLSIANCGLAVVESPASLLFVATVKPSRGLSPSGKRAHILQYVEAAWKKYNYGVIVMEKPFVPFGGGSKVPMFSVEAILGLSTTIEDWALRVGAAQVVKVASGSWRKEVLGNGRAKKDEAVRYVSKTFGRDLRDDAAEAVCQAVYGLRKWTT